MDIVNKKLGISSADVSKCDNRIQLMAWIDAIDEQLVGLKIARDNARRELASTGVFKMDYKAFSGIESVIKYQGLLLRQIHRRLGELKNTNVNTYERVFMDVCKRRLTGDLFKSICEEAHELVDGENIDN